MSAVLLTYLAAIVPTDCDETSFVPSYLVVGPKKFAKISSYVTIVAFFPTLTQYMLL